MGTDVIRWEDIDGYFTWPDYYDWIAGIAAAHSVPWHGVEVGCYKGKSAAYLAERLSRPARLDVVDIEMTKHDTRRSLAGYLEIDRMHEADSAVASAMYTDGTLDFVFIDADHSYASVRRDIDVWLPKVRPGGIIAGHDHCPDFTGVIQAVTETFPRYEVWRGMRGAGWGDQRMVDTGQYYAVWSKRCSL